jgi:hypothetical protein
MDIIPPARFSPVLKESMSDLSPQTMAFFSILGATHSTGPPGALDV